MWAMFDREEIVEMRLAQTRNAPGTAYSGLEPPVQPGAGDDAVHQRIDRACTVSGVAPPLLKVYVPVPFAVALARPRL